jgi:hypothetical protein
VSSQHNVDLATPYLLFGSLTNLLKPTIYDMITLLQIVFNTILNSSSYSEVWWRTSPITFYEIDMAHMVCYQYSDVTITYIDDTTHLSIPYRRTRIPESEVRGYLSVLLEFAV